MADRLTLPDGTGLWVWPLLSTDRRALAAEFKELSPESARRRFLGPVMHLTEAMLQHLVDDVDGVDHVALVVMGETESHDVVPVAIGRIVRYPDQPDAADLAVTVKDDWQGRGVASVLVPMLVAHRPPGVTRLLTEVSVDNPASLSMLRHVGPMRTDFDDQGGCTVEVQLPSIPAGGSPVPVGTDARPDGWHSDLHSRDHVCPWFRRGA